MTGAKFSSMVRRSAAAAAGLCAPSSATTGLAPMISKRPGTCAAPWAALTAATGIGVPVNASAAVRASSALSH